MNDMPEDLRWLAENVTEWPSAPGIKKEHRVEALYIYKSGQNIHAFYDIEKAPEKIPLCTKAQWQAARQQIERERESTITPEEESEYGPEHWNCRCAIVNVSDVLPVGWHGECTWGTKVDWRECVILPAGKIATKYSERDWLVEQITNHEFRELGAEERRIRAQWITEAATAAGYPECPATRKVCAQIYDAGLARNPDGN